MSKTLLLVCLNVVLLLAFSMIGLTSPFHNVMAQGEDIIVENADYVSTNLNEYSADLINIAKNVTPRMVMEYAATASTLNLNKSSDLNQAASVVTPRMTVEYADSILEYSFQSVTVPDIAPRIIVEYADFIFSTDLGPKPMEDINPHTIGIPTRDPPQDVMPYQNVTVSVTITDNESGVKNATIHYNLNYSTTWITILMKYNSTTGLYHATIPGQPEGTFVRYNIVAYDNAENKAEEDNAGQYYTYPVIPEFPSIIILSLFMMATLIVVTVCRRKHFV